MESDNQNKDLSFMEAMRPYSDSELPEVLAKVVEDPVFPMAAAFMYPDLTLQQVKDYILSFPSVRAVQGEVMRHAINRILSQSDSTLNGRFSPLFKNDKPYLFISNHRDIVLDAMLLQKLLFDNGANTSQIIFGNNLLSIPLMGELGRVNKMVGIDRGGSPREFYQCLSRTSCYIREVITHSHESVWIAQGNGRTKNGLDTTDPAIVKMLAMSSNKPLNEALNDLHILPISIAYEWEPCDMYKAIELTRSLHGKYQKTADEDYKSVLTGFFAKKGRIHIEIGDPLTPQSLTECNSDARKVAALLDSKIVKGYHLFPSNFIAADIRNNSTANASHYTPADREKFLARLVELEQRVAQMPDPFNDDDMRSLRGFFIDIYANPVSNAISHNLL